MNENSITESSEMIELTSPKRNKKRTKRFVRKRNGRIEKSLHRSTNASASRLSRATLKLNNRALACSLQKLKLELQTYQNEIFKNMDERYQMSLKICHLREENRRYSTQNEKLKDLLSFLIGNMTNSVQVLKDAFEITRARQNSLVNNEPSVLDVLKRAVSNNLPAKSNDPAETQPCDEERIESVPASAKMKTAQNLSIISEKSSQSDGDDCLSDKANSECERITLRRSSSLRASTLKTIYRRSGSLNSKDSDPRSTPSSGKINISPRHLLIEIDIEKAAGGIQLNESAIIQPERFNDSLEERLLKLADEVNEEMCDRRGTYVVQNSQQTAPWPPEEMFYKPKKSKLKFCKKKTISKQKKDVVCSEKVDEMRETGPKETTKEANDANHCEELNSVNDSVEITSEEENMKKTEVEITEDKIMTDPKLRLRPVVVLEDCSKKLGMASNNRKAKARDSFEFNDLIESVLPSMNYGNWKRSISLDKENMKENRKTSNKHPKTPLKLEAEDDEHENVKCRDTEEKKKRKIQKVEKEKENLVCDENTNGNEESDDSAQTRRRQRAVVNYKLPNINKKLRRGDNTGCLKIRKKGNKKECLSIRKFGDLSNQNLEENCF